MSAGGRFVSQNDVDAAREQRAQEWKEAYARLGQEPPKPAEEAENFKYDSRPLYERLKEQTDRKQEEFEEKIKLKNLYRGVDSEEVAFLDEMAAKKRSAEAEREADVAAELETFRQLKEKALAQSKSSEQSTLAISPADVVKLPSTVQTASSTSSNPILPSKPKTNAKSQKNILAGAIKRKSAPVPTKSVSNPVTDATEPVNKKAKAYDLLQALPVTPSSRNKQDGQVKRVKAFEQQLNSYSLMNLGKQAYSAYEQSQGNNQQQQQYNNNNNQQYQQGGGVTYYTCDDSAQKPAQYNDGPGQGGIDVQAAARHAQENDNSGSGDLFSNAMGFLNKTQNNNDTDVDEDDIQQKHQQAYQQGNAQAMDANSMGAAAAMQAMQKFMGGGQAGTNQTGGGSSGGGFQAKMIGMAMQEASKLFDQSGGAANGSKQDVVNSAGATVMKLLRTLLQILKHKLSRIVKNQVSGMMGGGSSSGISSMLSSFMK